MVNATISSGPKAVYVPIEPCRLADTRPGPDNVGTRATPIGQRDTHTFTVHGTNGEVCDPGRRVRDRGERDGGGAVGAVVHDDLAGRQTATDGVVAELFGGAGTVPERGHGHVVR
jgi:hypothetical protein